MPKPSPKPSGDSPAVDECVRVFRSILHMPDCSPVFAAVGAVAANYFQGDPVWLMLVGSPSTGKTVVVRSCSHLPNCRVASNADNSSAFLTWDAKRGLGGLLSPSRVEQGQETGGIGNFGILTYPDFTSILSQQPDTRNFISSVHREMYDGHWSREFGSAGGRNLEWTGKVGALGAVTPEIDRHTMNAKLGERWLYYRFPPPDQIAQANMAGSNHALDPMDKNAMLSKAVLDVFHDSGIARGDIPRELTTVERSRMSRTVRAACLLRGAIPRDNYSKDVVDLAQIEGAGRMFNALAGIFLALECLGLRYKWCWKIIRRIAFDSSPGLRLEFVKAALRLQGVGETITVKGVYPQIPISETTLKRVMEDVKMLGILTHNGHGEMGMGRDGHGWRVDEGIVKVMREMEDDI